MTADEAKEMADGVNQEHIDRADGDLDHVQIEISERAARGEYGLEYTFDPSKDYSLVNEIRNQLDEAGFEVEISGGDSPSEGYTLEIDWSKNS